MVINAFKMFGTVDKQLSCACVGIMSWNYNTYSWFGYTVSKSDAVGYI